MTARAAASPTQEAASCLYVWLKSPPPHSPRSASAASPAKSKESPRALACARGREGRTESATAVSLRAQHLCCVRSTISTAPPRPGAGSTVRPAPQMPFLPPACGEAFVATLARRANLAVSERAHSCHFRCRRAQARRSFLVRVPAGAKSSRARPGDCHRAPRQAQLSASCLLRSIDLLFYQSSASRQGPCQSHTTQ